MSHTGPSARALETLTDSQIQFLRGLPKAELHAHLNGSIPLQTLKELATAYIPVASLDNSGGVSGDAIAKGLSILTVGPSLDKIDDFFTLFPAIYALTSTPAALGTATRAVLKEFLDTVEGERPQCDYLELRTTPRATDAMNRELYLRTVLNEVNKYPADRAALIVSIDRRMSDSVLEECIGLAKKLKEEGERVVGIDLCGDPTAGDMKTFGRHFEEAKKAGLGITLHIAETTHNTPEETLKLLSYNPDRLGHATFLTDEAISLVLEKKIGIEICLTSNLLCKTVETLESHHIRQYLNAGHPIAICTDDILPFKTSMLGEYALLLAQPPFGLGLTEELVRRVGEMSLEARFGQSRT